MNGTAGGVLTPRYRPTARDGCSTDPLTVAGPEPIVDLSVLARLFTGPALFGELLPGAFWRGVRMEWEPPAPCIDRQPWPAVFRLAVELLCAETATVGVKLSGGLDSLAVLCQVARLQPARRIVVFCVDLVDDRGQACAGLVQELVTRVRQATGRAVEVVVVDPDPADTTAPHAWSALGPRLDSLPAVNTRINHLAAAAGVEMLLHGDGADELLAVPGFATLQVGAAYGLRAAARYLRQARRARPGWVGELCAGLADRVPPRARARWYWAANWPLWCAPTVSPVVPEPWRQAAMAWADNWITAQLEAHVRSGWRWAEADAADSFWPRGHTPPAGSVPEASPFLTGQVVAHALAMPLAERYDPTLHTDYHRSKAAVMALLPDWIRHVLPARKQYFTHALADAVDGPIAVPLAARAGLLDPDAVAASRDTATRMTAAAVESWLSGAVARGYRVPGLERLSVT